MCHHDPRAPGNRCRRHRPRAVTCVRDRLDGGSRPPEEPDLDVESSGEQELPSIESHEPEITSPTLRCDRGVMNVSGEPERTPGANHLDEGVGRDGVDLGNGIQERLHQFRHS